MVLLVLCHRIFTTATYSIFNCGVGHFLMFIFALLIQYVAFLAFRFTPSFFCLITFCCVCPLVKEGYVVFCGIRIQLQPFHRMNTILGCTIGLKSTKITIKNCQHLYHRFCSYDVRLIMVVFALTFLIPILCAYFLSNQKVREGGLFKNVFEKARQQFPFFSLQNFRKGIKCGCGGGEGGGYILIRTDRQTDFLWLFLRVIPWCKIIFLFSRLFFYSSKKVGTSTRSYSVNLRLSLYHRSKQIIFSSLPLSCPYLAGYLFLPNHLACFDIKRSSFFLLSPSLIFHPFRKGLEFQYLLLRSPPSFSIFFFLHQTTECSFLKKGFLNIFSLCHRPEKMEKKKFCWI